MSEPMDYIRSKGWLVLFIVGIVVWLIIGGLPHVPHFPNYNLVGPR